MPEPEQREHSLAKLAASGRLNEARLLSAAELSQPWAHNRPGEVVIAAMEGTLPFAGRRVLIRVGVCESFPRALPMVFVCPPDALGILPHIEVDGRICYAESEATLIDQDSPFNVLVDALSRAVQVLKAGLAGNNSIEFVRELSAYVKHHLKYIECPCYIMGDDELRLIVVSTRGQNQRILYVADDESVVRDFYNGQRWQRTHVESGLYVPLLPSAAKEVTDPKLFTHANWVRAFIWRHLSADNMLRLGQLKGIRRRDSVVVIKIPRPDGGIALLGLHFHRLKEGHQWIDGSGDDTVTPIILERRSRDALVPRGGGTFSLSNKHVILTGCGAVGGHLALALAQTGVGHLTLVDPDGLEAPNTFRHVMGHNGLGQRKVVALRWEIERKIPFIQVDAIPRRVEQVLKLKQELFQSADLVIFATGDPTLSLYLNRYFYSFPSKSAIIFTWLEPYGIGGHALLTQPHQRTSGVRGCYQCLFKRKPPDGGLFNTASFADRDQHFSKDLAGCGSLYTPYSALDAMRTAELACRLAVRALRGEELASPIWSWKGSAVEFLANGYRTSARHLLTEEMLHERQYSYVNSKCGICSGNADA